MLSPIQHSARSFMDLLKQYQIYFADDIAREFLRVHLTKSILENNMLSIDVDTVFSTMQSLNLDTFSGDKEMFWECFQAGQQLDFYETLLEVYSQDRTGIVIVPEQVTEAFSERISTIQPHRILIPEAHKFLRGLFEMVHQYLYCEFVLLAENYLHQQWLHFLFRDCDHVEVQVASLYSVLEMESFDYILAFPAFGRKSDVESERFITRESEGVAVENLLQLLDNHGELDIILPARFTFSGGSFARLRKEISQHYGVVSIYSLPSGTLRPYTMMKTYGLRIQCDPVEEVKIGEFRSFQGRFQSVDRVSVLTENFAKREDWRIELILKEAEQNKGIRESESQLAQIRLRDQATLFRGKSIMKSHIQPTGEIEVLNISNLEDGEIRWDNLDRIQEDFIKVQRYALRPYDLVLTCRGTVNKVAVVQAVSSQVIASANIIVVRFTDDPKWWSHYVKIFLETPAGLHMLQSFQRGTTVMNINPTDLAEMQIPVLPKDEMEHLVEKYIQEQQIYRSSILRAKARWDEQKQAIYQKWQ
ncbi:hypothetical protein [Shimazuella kribbensis]|uniref:hypothetical protein n=1 Tax=Shimazuella kribbensis TaxID=139808 RepID=UPI0004088711|nr:hypothetical protein [Shimazuella kribbensis]